MRFPQKRTGKLVASLLRLAPQQSARPRTSHSLRARCHRSHLNDWCVRWCARAAIAEAPGSQRRSPSKSSAQTQRRGARGEGNPLRRGAAETPPTLGISPICPHHDVERDSDGVCPGVLRYDLATFVPVCVVCCFKRGVHHVTACPCICTGRALNLQPSDGVTVCTGAGLVYLHDGDADILAAKRFPAQLVDHPQWKIAVVNFLSLVPRLMLAE